jgi:hypothetical protein
MKDQIILTEKQQRALAKAKTLGMNQIIRLSPEENYFVINNKGALLVGVLENEKAAPMFPGQYIYECTNSFGKFHNVQILEFSPMIAELL